MRKVGFILVLVLLSLLGNTLAFSKRGFELKVLAPEKFYKGSDGTVQVIAYDPATGSALKGVDLSLKGEAEGKLLVVKNRKTDEHGVATFKFKVPDVDSLAFEVRSGNNFISWEVPVVSSLELILTTDKPLYQPGQVIHIRTLALRAYDQKPLKNLSLKLTVSDPRGNKILIKDLRTDDYGISHVSLHLSPDALLGDYKIRCSEDKTGVVVEKTVQVKKYRLPKFKIEVTLPKTYYKPGEEIKGSLTVSYFFGKPVRGKARITLESYEVTFSKVGETSCELKEGRCQFSLKAPEYGVGVPLAEGGALLRLRVVVTDEASQEGEKDLILKLVKEPLSLVVVPDSDELIPGVENLLYLSVARPDGTPVIAEVEVTDGKERVKGRTDSKGFLTLRFTPREGLKEVKVVARTSNGYEVRKFLKLRERTSFLILRPSKLIAVEGETLLLDVITPKSWEKKSVFLEAFREGESLGTWSTVIRRGRARFRIPLSSEMVGTITFVGYVVDLNGNTVSSIKKVLVRPAKPLRVILIPDKSVYRPGEEMTLAVKLSKAGKPMSGAVELSLVDEALLYLASKDPQLLKLLLRLEKELLSPKYEIHGISVLAGREDIIKLALVKASNEEKAPLVERDSYVQKLKTLLKTFVAILRDSRYTIAQRRLEELPRNPLKLGFSYREVLDPWGTPLRIEKLSLTPEERDILVRYDLDTPFIPVSAGPDRRWDTEDDISLPDLLLMLGRRKVDLDSLIYGNTYNRYPPLMRALAPLGVKEKVGFQVTPERKTVALALKEEKSTERPRSSKLKGKRVRSFFPETAYYNPELIVTSSGEAKVKIPLPDSITTWKLRAFANTLSGGVGSATADVRVFQPFFVDLDLPLYLTRGDEVSIPVKVYNYTKRELEVKLRLKGDKWYELIDAREKSMTLKPGDVRGTYFTIRARELGVHEIEVEAETPEFSDAIRKTIEVIPRGIEFHQTRSGELKTTELSVKLPRGIIEDATKVKVFIYPTLFSQVLGGLDRLLRMPYGCFEQTTSITYPNALILRYLRENNLTNPELEAKANYYLQVGYQRLISYEVKGGGFSWFGNPPANKLLTAFGLMEFSDMNEVYPVDKELVKRTREWLFSQMEEDHWTPDSRYLHLETWSKLKDSDLVVTAFILWGISKTQDVIPLTPEERVKMKRAARWIEEQLGEDLKGYDPYTLAIIGNSLNDYLKVMGEDEELRKLRDKVVKSLEDRVVKEGSLAFWRSKMTGITYSRGKAMDIETTALAVQVLINGNGSPELIREAINFLVANKDPFGGWYTTQGTIQTLRSMLMIKEKRTTLRKPLKVKIVAYRSEDRTEKAERSLTIKPEDFQGYLIISLPVRWRNFLLRIEPDRDVSGAYWNADITYYVPPELYRPPEEPLTLKVYYDKKELQVKDTVLQKLEVINSSNEVLNMVLIDVGVPPGFVPVLSDLDDLVSKGSISRYEYTGRQIVIYLKELRKEKLILKWRLKALYPVKVNPPSAKAYEYYNPDKRSLYLPQGTIKVTRRKR